MARCGCGIRTTIRSLRAARFRRPGRFRIAAHSRMKSSFRGGMMASSARSELRTHRRCGWLIMRIKEEWRRFACPLILNSSLLEAFRESAEFGKFGPENLFHILRNILLESPLLKYFPMIFIQFRLRAIDLFSLGIWKKKRECPIRLREWEESMLSQ